MNGRGRLQRTRCRKRSRRFTCHYMRLASSKLRICGSCKSGSRCSPPRVIPFHHSAEDTPSSFQLSSGALPTQPRVTQASPMAGPAHLGCHTAHKGVHACRVRPRRAQNGPFRALLARASSGDPNRLTPERMDLYGSVARDARAAYRGFPEPSRYVARAGEVKRLIL